MKKVSVLLSSVLFAATMNAFASDQEIKSSLARIGIPEVLVQITETELPNWKQVTVQGTQYFVSEDGAYLMRGSVFNIQGAAPVNINNAHNKKWIKTIEDQAILYKAPEQKYVIDVFTDYTCGYCQKLHQEIDDYLKAGITVRYFGFPRAGMGSEEAKKMQAVWNAKDQTAALDALYKGKWKEEATNTKQIDHFFAIGAALGLSGTPAIMLPDGELIGGYMPADELLSILQEQR